MWSGQWPGPSRGLRAGPGHQIMTIVLRAGPGHTFSGRTGSGPHNPGCGPGPGRVCTTAASLGRAWSSKKICGPGLGLNFRPVQVPKTHHNTWYHGISNDINHNHFRVFCGSIIMSWTEILYNMYSPIC